MNYNSLKVILSVFIIHFGFLIAYKSCIILSDITEK